MINDHRKNKKHLRIIKIRSRWYGCTHFKDDSNIAPVSPPPPPPKILLGLKKFVEKKKKRKKK